MVEDLTFTSPFPDSPRVLYDNNPLELVICQLRYPTILRIDAEPPAAFQDAIRGRYPLLRQTSGPSLPAELPPEVKALVGRLSPGPAETAYDFTSDDERWTIGLTRDFIALTTRRYERWQEFKDRLRELLQVFAEQYHPAFFGRVGLRYRDVITPSALGLEGQAWSEMLQPQIAGELVNPQVAQAAEQCTRELTLKLEPEGRVHIQHGIAERSDTKERTYLIDADFFTEERTSLEDAYNKLDNFNRHAGRLFRWCITEQLHTALGPNPI